MAVNLATYSHDGLNYTVREGDRGRWDRGIVREVEETYLWDRIPWADVRYAVDVGGHIGSWTLQAARRAKQARFVAIEPFTENFVLMAVNVHSELQRITTLHGAIYYTQQPMTLLIAGPNSGRNVVQEGGAGVPVSNVWTLEQVCEAEGFAWIDVLKLDCEGSERNILASMTDDLLIRTRYLIGEFHCTAEAFLEHHAARLSQTHRIELIPHPDKNVKDLGMFFMEHKLWRPFDSVF